MTAPYKYSPVNRASSERYRQLGGGDWSRFRPSPTPPDCFYLSPALRGLEWEEGAQITERAAVDVLFAL